jgi:hypothetical protein
MGTQLKTEGLLSQPPVLVPQIFDKCSVNGATDRSQAGRITCNAESSSIGLIGMGIQFRWEAVNGSLIAGLSFR